MAKGSRLAEEAAATTAKKAKKDAKNVAEQPAGSASTPEAVAKVATKKEMKKAALAAKAEAIKAALATQELIQWQDIHVQSPVDHQRYITKTAARLLPELAGRLSS